MNDLFFITGKATNKLSDLCAEARGKRFFVALENHSYLPLATAASIQTIRARSRSEASWWLDLETAIGHYDAFIAQTKQGSVTQNFEQIEIWKYNRSDVGAKPEVVWPVKGEPVRPGVVDGLLLALSPLYAKIGPKAAPPLTFKTKWWRDSTKPMSLLEAVEFTRSGHHAGSPSRELVGADFADFGDRKLLAELGHFSVDLKPHRAKREREALIKRYLEEAYDAAGLDRNEQHNIIAAKMEATKTDGVWAKSTGEYAIACRRLDNFMLRNSPAIEQSVRDLEANTKELTMPTIDEAIKRACVAYREDTDEIACPDGMRAAISAFLADVPVSVEMIECGLGAYDDCDARSGLGGFDSEVAQYKAMSAKLAEEIQ